MTQPKRMTIDQPSYKQPFHGLHGVRVLAMPDTDVVMRVYFLGGDTVSMQIPKLCLTEGW